MTGTLAAALLAAVAMCGGAGVVDHERDASGSPSHRTAVTSVGQSHVGPVTTVWRPR